MTRPPLLRAFEGEIIVDNFAGGGGASTGIEAAIGRPCDIAINHDAAAIAMHRENHPETRHYQEDIWEVDPVEACAGRPVGLAWFSPDCTHFSRAKGATPREQKIRGLAWIVIKWARLVQPRIIILENVDEFRTWGPLDPEGAPIADRAGETFRHWVTCLRDLGYRVEWKQLAAADYGAPTTRKRLYLIARRDERMAWPDASHGDSAAPHLTAADCIDWTLPVPSIFERKRPLAEKTYQRIADGVRRYVIEAAEPFIVRHGHYFKNRPTTFRGQGLDRPLATVCATNDKNLVVPLVTKHYGGVVGTEMRRPLGSITARDSHALTAAFLRRRGIRAELPETMGEHREEVRAFLLKYYGRGGSQDIGRPLHTVTSKARFGLVTVAGVDYRVTDIGMRMLAPRELYRAQGFPDDYRIDFEFNGKPLTKENQIRMAGNSVCPPVAQALVAEAIQSTG